MPARNSAVGNGAQSGPELPEHLNTSENLDALELLRKLVEDVDNLDVAVAEFFLALDGGDVSCVFQNGAFAGTVAAIGMPLMLTCGRVLATQDGDRIPEFRCPALAS